MTGTEARRRPLGELLAPVRGRLAVAVGLQLVSALAAIVPFVCVVELAREVLAAGPADDRRVWTLIWVAVGALLLRLVTMGTATLLTHLADNDLQLHLRLRIARRLGSVPLGWFTDRTSGAVKSAVQDDVAAMHHLVGHGLINLAAAVVTPVAVLGYLFWVDWRLTLVTLLPAVVFLVAHLTMMRGFGAHMDRYVAAMTRINAAVVEFVQGIAVVKTFGQTRRAHDRFRRAADEFAEFWWGWVRPMLRWSSLSMAAVAGPTVLVLVLGAGIWFVANGWAPPMDVVPFALLGLALTAPLLTLEYGTMDLKLASAAAGRVATLLETPTLPEPEQPRRPAGHRVEFAGVRFSYDGSTEVLRGIDAVLEPGTVTALVGPSGSGKTTLASLLPRFWDVTAGAVMIGGVDVREIGSAQLYRRVGFVFQDVQLLRSSVRDNIALARPDATTSDVVAVARAAQIHRRIEQLPRGYDSVIGDDAQLSAGEAQRVSIARALLADTPILVLDEATAFADPESEAAIQDALSTLVAGRTLLVVAHRLRTIVHADQILVLDRGEVIERGRHERLLAAATRYARMWAAQERSATHDWADTRAEGVGR